MSVYTAAVGGNLVYRSPTVSAVTTSTPMAECSGIGVSRTYNQVVWCHDDSGDTPARIFAFNTANGLLKKVYNMVNPSGGAAWSNSDFEDMSLFQRASGGDLIFVYDTISNAGTTSGRLYRMVEPDPNVGVQTQNINANQITISFPSGVYSEANFVDPLDGHFIVFHTSTNSDITVWRSTTSVVTALNQTTVSMVQIANLGEFAPIPPVISGHTCEWLGSADIAPDRSCIVLHPTSGNSPHYDRILIYNIADPFTTSIATALATTPVLGSDDGTGRDVVTEVQGEATAFLPASNGYMRLGEGSNRPIHIVDDKTPATPAPAPIVSLMPDGRNFSMQGAQVTTSLDGLTQYATWVTRSGGLMVGRRARNSHTWTTHTFTGANATALGLPFIEDDHCYPVIAVDAANRLWIVANQYSSTPMRAVRTTNGDGNVAGPWQTATFPDSAPLIGYTYPQFCRFSDGTLIFAIGANGADGLNGNHVYWRKTPTGTTWTEMPILLKGNNFSPPWTEGPVPNDTSLGKYPNQFFVEPPGWTNPDRVHVSWLWRITDDPGGGGGVEESAYPSYIYSDDKGTTWRSVTGTAMTLPIQINTNTSCRMHPTQYYWPGAGPAGTHIINGGSIVIEKDTGYPYIIFGGNPPTTNYNTIFHWNGSAWSSEDLTPVSIGNVARGNLVWFRNDLWWLGKWPTGSDSKPIHLFSVNTSKKIRLGGSIPRGNPNPEWLHAGLNAPGNVEPMYDLEAFALFGTVEVLVPIGDEPKVYAVGKNALTRT